MNFMKKISSDAHGSGEEVHARFHRGSGAAVRHLAGEVGPARRELCDVRVAAGVMIVEEHELPPRIVREGRGDNLGLVDGSRLRHLAERVSNILRTPQKYLNHFSGCPKAYARSIARPCAFLPKAA